MPGVDDLLRGLNPQQREAVTHGDGPLLIFAGAGSGKTRVLTHRIAYLIAARGVRPRAILAVTFTNKAAGEMRERIHQLTGHSGGGMWVGTFHGMCARILRQSGEAIGVSPDFTIYDQSDQEAVMKAVVGELGWDTKDQANSPRSQLERISRAKNELMSPEEFARRASEFADKKAAQAYRLYQGRLDAARALDFDDLIRRVVDLFVQHPSVLEEWRQRFGHVLIDEYQDINFAQYSFVTRLAAVHRNICAVGDDDQSIYRWRGADVRLILQFEKDFPNAHVVKLEQNYRSTQRILDAAHAVITHNRARADKKLWTDRGEGQKLRAYEAIDERQEALWIAGEVKRWIGKEGAYSDHAVLYRTNAQSRVLEEVLRDEGIPYRLVGGVRFYDRKEVKDLLAYLRLLYNPFDIVSLRRTINTPTRGIGDAAVERLEAAAADDGVTPFQSLMKLEGYKERLARSYAPLKGYADLLKGLLAAVEATPIPELITRIIVSSGYEASLKKERSAEADGRLENLYELATAAEKYAADSEDPSLGGFLEHVALVSDVDSLDQSSNAVTLMTLHAAKGLEFSRVFIAGFEEYVFPHQRAMIDEQELAEERRLCYVGMTRAEDELVLTHARVRSMFGQTRCNPPSRFLAEVPHTILEWQRASSAFRVDLDLGLAAHGAEPRRRLDLTDVVARHKRPGGPAAKPEAEPGTTGATYSPGDRVRHSTYGDGVVVSAEPGFVQVAFERQGVRKLALAFAPLVKV